MNLNDIISIRSLDKSNASGSIEMLPQQIEQSFNQVLNINIPQNYKNAKNIVIAGMGGSAYGARILKSLYDKDIKIPIYLANDYHLPGFVKSDSLVFLCSYSGSTEETLSCAKETIEKKALISGATSGGKLGEILKDYPSYTFIPVCNPSNQPRMGVGYMVVGLLTLVSQMGFITLSKEEISKTVSFLKNSKFQNQTQELAQKIKDAIPVFIVADFLEGAAHAIRNPIHETGKQFGLYFTIPELNHHLMEGLKFPLKAKNYLKFIFIISDLNEERNIKRILLTKEIIEKNGYNTISITLKSHSRFSQTMELIQLGNWFSFYLAMLNGIDPSPVPWVDYFKKELTITQ